MNLEVAVCSGCNHEHVCAPFAGGWVCQDCAKGEDCGIVTANDDVYA